MYVQLIIRKCRLFSCKKWDSVYVSWYFQDIKSPYRTTSTRLESIGTYPWIPYTLYHARSLRINVIFLVFEFSRSLRHAKLGMGLLTLVVRKPLLCLSSHITPLRCLNIASNYWQYLYNSRVILTSYLPEMIPLEFHLIIYYHNP